MGSGSHQDQDVAFQAPDQQLIRPDVAFPAIGPVAGQPVLPVTWIERLLRGEPLDDGPEFIEVASASLATPEIPLELRCGE